MPYRPSSVPPTTAWARRLDALRQERGWSQTRLFEEVRGELHLSDKSRAAFLPLLQGTEPTPDQAKALRDALGVAPGPEDYEAVKARAGGGVTDSPDLAAAFMHFADIQKAQTDALAEQTKAIRELVGEIRAMRLSGAPGALAPEDLEKIVGLVAGTLEAETVDVRESAGSGRERRMVARRGGSGAPA